MAFRKLLVSIHSSRFNGQAVPLKHLMNRYLNEPVVKRALL